MNPCIVLCVLLCLFSFTSALGQGTRLLRHPTVSRDQIAFEYAGDLWLVARTGGQARRITSTQGLEIEPHFSPDGTQIAFTATVAGNTDVYVVPTTGGNPKRLTYHPGTDVVRGWSGSKVMYASGKASATPRYSRLFLVDAQTGEEDEENNEYSIAGTEDPPQDDF